MTYAIFKINGSYVAFYDTLNVLLYMYLGNILIVILVNLYVCKIFIYLLSTLNRFFRRLMYSHILFRGTCMHLNVIKNNYKYIRKYITNQGTIAVEVQNIFRDMLKLQNSLFCL